MILVQIHYKLSHRQAKFPRILSQKDQNDLKGQGQWPSFSISAKSNPTQYACLVQIWSFEPKSVMQAVFKIRSETCRTEAQFCQNLYMIKKESLPDRPKFCRSMSAVRYLFWRLCRVPTKISEKSSMIFHDFSRPKSKFPDKKKIPIFVYAAHVSNCRINYRQTQTHTHIHTRFDQGQPTIQLILLVIELIQEVKTTLVNLIKMGNRFSYQHLKNDIDFSFPYKSYI